MELPELNNVGFRFIPDDSLETTSENITGRDNSGLIDFIDGGGGHDNIDGRDGSDVLIGGAGEDEVFGGDGGNMDFLLGGILDFAEGFDLQQAISEVSEFSDFSEFSGLIDAMDLSQVHAGLVNILDNATNLQDVVDGVTEAVGGSSSELQQAVGVLLEGLPQVLTWQQDDYTDTFKAAGSSEENGVDIIFGYDDAEGGDLIDFSTMIDLASGSDIAKENSINSFIEYNETTGALTDDQDNDWFFVYSNVNPLNPNPADTVYVHVDGETFVWDTVENEFDLMA